jgi:hypothetical protein
MRESLDCVYGARVAPAVSDMELDLVRCLS